MPGVAKAANDENLYNADNIVPSLVGNNLEGVTTTVYRLNESMPMKPVHRM